LIIQFVVDEEVGGNGTLASLSMLDGPVDMALIGEPTELAVCTQSRSFEQFKILTYGRPRHMCFGARSENAVWGLGQALEVIEATDEWCRKVCEEDRRFLCAGMVRGGTDAAVPASKAELFVTAALPPQLPFERMIAHLECLLAERFGSSGTMAQVEPYGQRFAGSTEGHKELAAVLSHVMEERSIAFPRASCFPSACDARIFEAFGIGTVICGPGSLWRAHGPDEYVEVGELRAYAEMLTEAMVRILGGTRS